MQAILMLIEWVLSILVVSMAVLLWISLGSVMVLGYVLVGLLIVVGVGAKLVLCPPFASACQTILGIMPMFVIVVLQKEIRMWLLASYRYIEDMLMGARHHEQDLNLLIDLVYELSARKQGALLVFDNSRQLGPEILSKGIQINAELSISLLKTLLLPDSLVTDGGMVIRNNRLVGLGVVFPISTENKNRFVSGARHIVGQELSEYSGIKVVILSENGVVSFAYKGTLSSGIQQDKLKSLIKEDQIEWKREQDV